MAIYTGVADANGDFNISFGSQNYTSGEKITVTAEKDSATKSIELYAPADVAGGGVIRFSGTLDNFPTNIGIVSIVNINGKISDESFGVPNTNNYGLGAFATGLLIGDGVTEIGKSSFQGWKLATSLVLPASITILRDRCFSGWVAMRSVTIPQNVTLIEQYAFYNWAACDEIKLLSNTPPSITSLTFNGLKSTCIFKVPAASVAAYQAAPNWSAFAAMIQAI